MLSGLRSVHQAGVVGFAKRLAYGDGHPQGARGLKAPIRTLAQQLRQLLAVQALHRDVEQAAVGLAKVEHAHGVGVRQQRRRPRLVEEPLNLRRVFAQIGL